MSSETIWNLVTNFGDSAIGLPLALLVLLVLLASGWLRGAAAWFFSVASCVLAMLALKIGFGLAFAGCGPGEPGAMHFSPSGHAALSAVTYGGLAVLTGRHLPELARLVLAIATSAWVCTIAASRVELRFHSPVEAAVGLVVGAAAVALLVVAIGRSTGPRWLAPALTITTLAVLAAMHGTRWPVEEHLHAVAAWLRGSVGLCAR